MTTQSLVNWYNLSLQIIVTILHYLNESSGLENPFIYNMPFREL